MSQPLKPKPPSPQPVTFWVNPPIGYRVVDGRIVIHPEEAQIVRQAFHDYLKQHQR